MDFVAQPEILAGVKQREQWMRAELEKINQKYQLFKEIRGKGLLLGAALNDEWQGRARDILVAAGKQGLMVLVAGRAWFALRHLSSSANKKSKKVWLA